jgi:putative copper resistance protein D
MANAARLSPWQRAAGYGLVLAGAGAGALAFGMWGTERPEPGAVALPSPGTITTWGLPIAQLTVTVSVVGTIGMLVTGLLLPRQDGELGAVARRCLAGAGLLALAWAVAAAAMLVFSWSEFAGVPVAQASVDRVFGGADPYPDAMAYLFGAALAVIIAGGAYITRTVIGVAVVLLLAAYNVLPLTTRGHDVDGPVIGIAVTVHVLAMAVWVGGLAGLLIHVRRSPTLLAVAVPRFSRLALACFVAVGASGLVAAWVNLGALSELRGSHFGTLVIYKAEALAALGIFGWWHRRRTVPEVARGSSGHGFTRFAAVEVVVMAATIALGVALAHTPAPAAPAPTTPTPNPYGGVGAPLHPGHAPHGDATGAG